MFLTSVKKCSRADAALERHHAERQSSLLTHAWPAWARPSQLPPPGNWRAWLFLAGRGAGKTRAGAEWVRQLVEQEAIMRIALVAPTAADARDVMVLGESGIIAL